jgi:hypothetical protein
MLVKVRVERSVLAKVRARQDYDEALLAMVRSSREQGRDDDDEEVRTTTSGPSQSSAAVILLSRDSQATESPPWDSLLHQLFYRGC